MESQRPYVQVSVIMSLDGCIDDAGPERLILSGAADLDRVDALRAQADVIMVGANTIRRDRPRLVLRSQQRRKDRLAAGRGDGPVKVTMTSTGELDPGSGFFTLGAADKIVYATTPAWSATSQRLAGLAQVVDAGATIDLARVLADLSHRGYAGILVEPGTRLLTGLLTAGLVDHLRLAVAPMVVADPDAPRLLTPAGWSGSGWAKTRLVLVATEQLGEIAVLHYRRQGSSHDQLNSRRRD